jgi:hypothetical protein
METRRHNNTLLVQAPFDREDASATNSVQPLNGSSSRRSTEACAFQLLAASAPSGVASTNNRMIQPDAMPRTVPILFPALMDEPISWRIAPVSANCLQRNTANGTHHPKQLADA